MKRIMTAQCWLDWTVPAKRPRTSPSHPPLAWPMAYLAYLCMVAFMVRREAVLERWPMVRRKAVLERYAALRCLWHEIGVAERTNR
eukprot:706233-Prymnesium_polylepis.1